MDSRISAELDHELDTHIGAKSYIINEVRVLVQDFESMLDLTGSATDLDTLCAANPRNPFTGLLLSNGGMKDSRPWEYIHKVHTGDAAPPNASVMSGDAYISHVIADLM